MNHITVVGNLGRDPELTYTPTGTAVTKASLADQMRDKDSEPLTHWWSLVLFGKQAEYFSEHAKKGSKVVVMGKLQKRQWKGKDGKEHEAMEVIVDTFSIIGASTTAQGKPTQQGDGVPDDFPF